MNNHRKERFRWKYWMVTAFAGVLVIAGLAFARIFQPARHPVTTLTELSSMTSEQLQDVPIEILNLLSAEGVSTEGRMNVAEAEAAVSKMAERVEAETKRNFHQFRSNPGNFEGSEAYFRMLVLVTVLHEDFGVCYNPARIGKAGVFEANESFFADPRDVFVHGLVSGRHMGTCASMPVLHTAVGRRLGYPLKLVAARNHLFVRWEDGNERRNFETTGDGLNSFSDDYYRQWPLPISPEEEKRFGYLKSLNASEELGVFLSIRGSCLLTAGRKREGLEIIARANRLFPVPFSSASSVQAKL